MYELILLKWEATPAPRAAAVLKEQLLLTMGQESSASSLWGKGTKVYRSIMYTRPAWLLDWVIIIGWVIGFPSPEGWQCQLPSLSPSQFCLLPVLLYPKKDCQKGSVTFYLDPHHSSSSATALHWLMLSPASVVCQNLWYMYLMTCFMTVGPAALVLSPIGLGPDSDEVMWKSYIWWPIHKCKTSSFDAAKSSRDEHTYVNQSWVSTTSHPNGII